MRQEDAAFLASKIEEPSRRTPPSLMHIYCLDRFQWHPEGSVNGNTFSTFLENLRESNGTPSEDKEQVRISAKGDLSVGISCDA